MNKTIPTNRKYMLGAAAVASLAMLAVLTVPANAEDTALLDIIHGIFTNTESLPDDLDELKVMVHEIKETIPTLNIFNQGIVGHMNDEGTSVMRRAK